MTREIKHKDNQYGARRTRLKEHLLPPLKQKKTHTNKSTNNKNSIRSEKSRLRIFCIN